MASGAGPSHHHSSNSSDNEDNDAINRRNHFLQFYQQDQDFLNTAANGIQANLAAAAAIYNNAIQPERPHLGSIAGRKYRNRNRAMGNARVKADYFGPNPTYDEGIFNSRNRMSSKLFLRIRSRLKQHSDVWKKKYDAAGKVRLSSRGKMLCALQTVAYGTPADFLDQYFRIAKSTILSYVKLFCQHIVEVFGPEYLREPNQEDIARLLNVAELRGFPGMLGSLDCMHWTWEACPTEWAGQYTGRHGAATIVLEAVASYDMWIWHAYFGLPGTNNDVNVLWRSTLFNNLMFGLTPPANYTLMGRNYAIGYYLTDGIYPKWSTLVKAIKKPRGEREQFFTQMQECYRKDVERAFGVLQKRFAIVRGRARLWEKDVLHDVMSACIIMHNMIVEEERHTYVHAEEFGDLPPTRDYNYEEAVVPHIVLERDTSNVEFIRVLQRLAYMHNRVEHRELEQRLINHLWEWRANQ